MRSGAITGEETAGTDVEVPGAGDAAARRAGADIRAPRSAVGTAAGADSTGGGIPLWAKGVLPLLLLGILLLGFLRFGPVGVFRAAFPPVEELTIQRVSFPAEGQIRVHVVNGGPEPVTVGQVMVDDAFWAYRMEGGATLDRLRGTTIDIPYPWVEGEPVGVTLLTETGLTFHVDVDVATRSPEPDARYLSTFALLGIYVGVIPVFLGLLWLPFLKGIERRWLNFFLAFTLGLLIFLGVDALAEAIEMSAVVASAFQGLGLVTLGLVGTPLLIEGVGRLRDRGPASEGAGLDGFRVALLIAVGIGLHNLGEGLAIGSAYAVGEIALGTGLVVGFLLHNTTEGIGIVAPVAREGIGFGHLVLLGALAGVPTIIGAWIGGFTYSPTMAVLFLAVGAGAVAQVSWTLGRLLKRAPDGEGGLTAPLNATGLVAGLAVMYVTGLLVAV